MTNRTPKLISIATLALVSGAVAAAPIAAPEPLTLMQALQYAATGNIDLRRERIAIDTARAGVLTAEGKFDFVLSGDGTVARQPPQSLGSLTSGPSSTALVNLQLGRALETGGQVALVDRFRYVNSGSSLGCTDPGGPGSTCAHMNDLTLVFSHPLLRGFGTEIAQANLNKQRIQRDLALLNRQARASLVVRDTVIGYWELAYQTEDLAIRRSAVELARQQLRTTQAMIDVQRVGKLELAAVEAAIAARQQEVATGEQELVLRGLDLMRLFGRPVPPTFAGYASGERPSAGAHEVDVAADITRALQNSPALKSLKMGIGLTDIDIQVAAASVRSRLDFAGSVGVSGRDNGTLSDSLAQTSRFDRPTWSAGLIFELPVQNRAARGAEQTARLTGERATLDAGDLELAIRDGVARLGARIHAASQREQLARAAVGYAGQNLEAERARFEVGRSTNNDVLLRQQELKQAEIAVARATVDLLVNDAALAALTGDILDRYQIKLQ
jgi:outer membrane protein